jgi:RIO kinase 1
MRNLQALKRAGVRVPEPYYCTGALVAMQFLGTDHSSSPQLRVARVSSKRLQSLYDDLVCQMRKMYDAGIVHGDLSEYNLLVHEKQLWIIDLANAVHLDDPRAQELLRQDCENVTRFFSKTLRIPNAQQLYDTFA